MAIVTYPDDLRAESDRDPNRTVANATGARGTRSQLRFITCGSVDDGKSTLMGRLLFEASAVTTDQMAKLRHDSRTFGTTNGDLDYALLFDGLEDERAQGITIDVSYRYFETARRAFIVADTPGHDSYTRNMATAASTSEAAVILVDARKGVLKQTRRHATICYLFGVRSFVLAVNKFDLVGYDQASFDRIVNDFTEFAARLGIQEFTAIPLSARLGDNVGTLSGNTPWYEGITLIDCLESFEGTASTADKPFRLAVTWISRPSSNFRGYAGSVASGSVQIGMQLGVSGTRRQGTVRHLLTSGHEVTESISGDAITIEFDENLDVARGDILHPLDNTPSIADQFQAHVLWMDEDPLLPGRQYLLRLGSRHVLASVTSIKYALDMDTLEHLATEQLSLNDIAVCNLTTAVPIAFDPFAENPATGSFILIDRDSYVTAAAGMIDFALARANNLHPQRLTVDKAARVRLTRQRPAILWFTGLSGAGKSTIADLVERDLHSAGHMTYLLDGDNVRRGLNRDLGFTTADRVENIRRVGEVARLFVDAGLIVLCAFISPFAAERRLVREMVEEEEFLEIFVDTEIEMCIARDPKGLYAKARQGGIRNFTGLNSPYERPIKPELHIRTSEMSAQAASSQVIALLRQRKVISSG